MVYFGRVELTKEAKINISIAKLIDAEIEINDTIHFNYAFGQYFFHKKFLDNGVVILYVISAIDEKEARLLTILKIHPNFIKSDLSTISAHDLFFEFMDNFGLPIPEFGGKKYLVDYDNLLFVLGELDREKYQNALKNEKLI